jgi:hypothetical protein
MGLQTIIKSTTYRGQARTNGHHIEVEPLVSVEVWEAAQSAVAPRPARRTGSLLGGMMTCSSCGGTMSNTSAGKSGRYSNYKCQASRAGHSAECPRRMAVGRPLADKAVEAALLEWAGDALDETGTDGSEQGLIAALGRLDEAQAELAAYAEATSARSAQFLPGLESREREVESAQAVVDQLKAERKVESVRVRLADIWPDLSLEDKRRMIAQAVESIVVMPPVGKSLGGWASEEARVAAVHDRLIITFRSDAL